MSARIEVSPISHDHVPGVTPRRPGPVTGGSRATVEIGPPARRDTARPSA